MAKLSPDQINVVINLSAKEKQAEIKAAEDSIKRLTQANKDLRQERTRLIKTGEGTAEDFKRIDAAIRNNNREIANNRAHIRELESSLSLTDKSAAQLSKRLKELKTELAHTSKSVDPKKYAELSAEIRRTESALANATREGKGFLSGFLNINRVGDAVKGAFMGIAAALTTHIIGAFKSAAAIVTEFTAENSRLAAILGTTREGVSQLTEQAKELGRTTTATASQVTGLQIELAKLGFAQDTIEEMTPSVLKFSKAVGTDLSSAAAFAGATLRIFDKDASETDDVLATLAIATNKSALDFTKLQASMSTIGPVAASFGLSLEDTTALLGVLANAGFDASSAATATRNILLKLCDANGELARALGGPVDNLDGLVAGLQKLNAEGVDLGRVLELTDKRSVAAFSNFLKQADSLTELRDNISGVTDEFDEMAKTMADNSKGAQAGFSSAVEGFILSFGDGIESLQKGLYNIGTLVVQLAQTVLQPFNVIFSVLGGVVNFIATLTSKVKEAANSTSAWGKVLDGILTALKAVITYITTFSVVMGASKLAVTLWTKAVGAGTSVLALFRTGIGKAATAVKAFSTSLSTGVIGVISLAVTAITLLWDNFSKKTEDLLSKQKKVDKEIADSAAEAAAKEKAALDALYKTATNDAKSRDERLAAVKRLQEQYPAYFKNLTTEQIMAGKAADKYNELSRAIIRTAKARAAQDKIQENAAKMIELEEELDKLQDRSDNLAKTVAGIRAKGGNTNVFTESIVNADAQPGGGASHNASDLEAALDAYEENERRRRQKKSALGSLIKENDRLYNKYVAGNEENNAQPTTPTSFSSSQAAKGSGSTKENPIAQATAKAIDDHQQRLLEIINAKDSLSTSDYEIKKVTETIRYCDERLQALEELRKTVKETDTELIGKISAQEVKILEERDKAEEQLSTAQLSKAKEGYDERIKATDAFYSTIKATTERQVKAGAISQEKADVYLLNMQIRHDNERLDQLRKYYEEVESLEDVNENDRKTRLEKIQDEINSTNNSILTDTANMMAIVNALQKSSNPNDSANDKYETKKKALQDQYGEVIKWMEAEGMDTTEIKEELNRQLLALDREYYNELYNLRSHDNDSLKQKYDHELKLLDDQLAAGEISYKEYLERKKKLDKKYNDDQISRAQDAIQKVSAVVSMGSGLFTAMQESEIAASDAKYDELIRQAENNGEETAALEEEKQEKQLEIQKKYADTNFAIKCAQIIADTAVAAMKAYADLGPIAGAIAAVMVAATGAIQLKTAKAERDRIKNLQPARTARKGKEGTVGNTGERVLTGYSEGGYTGDGDRYEVAGVVHRGEYVVPKPIMGLPRVVDAVGTIEAIRRSRGLGAARGSYAEGGYTGDGGGAGGAGDAGLAKVVAELSAAVRDLQARPLKAYVPYTDIEKTGSELEQARRRFTRNR